MKAGRLVRGWAVLTAMFIMSGCAQLPPSFREQSPARHSEQLSSLPLMPTQSAGIRRLLDYGGDVAVLPHKDQTAACDQAKTQLNRHPSDHARMTLALLAAVVPECLPSDQLHSILEPLANNPESPFRALARIVSNVSLQRETSAQALALARQEAAGLSRKLKALTRIETQLNQVKDRELQNIH